MQISNIKSMKKLFIKLLLFGILCIFADSVFGIVMDYVYHSTKGGDTGRELYISEYANEDIIFLGSSRCTHHYDTKIFEDSLGMSSYNCGADGSGIILNYARYKLLSQRYTPKVIIYDLYYNFDLNTDDKLSDLAGIKTQYKNGIDTIFWTIDQTERIKMLSNLYRYNSNFIQYFGDYLHPISEVGYNGYLPLKGIISYDNQEDIETQKSIYDVDSLKLYYFERLIKETKGQTKLFFIISPMHKKTDIHKYDSIIQLCDRYNVPFYSFLDDSCFLNDSLFVDRMHLNNVGAAIFSKDVVKLLKSELGCFYSK